MTIPFARVSLGMPVFNGEEYLTATIESLLAQSFPAFELIISDNASNDRTQAICEAYAATDPRIRYSRNPTNLGAARNFNRVVELASGEYFKWAAHDDLLAPTFLEECIAQLDQDPACVLSYPRAQIIDESGELLEEYDKSLRTESEKGHLRFRDLLIGHACFEVFGVIRTDMLRRTPLMGNYGHADGVLLVRLALLGRFREVHETLFFPRRHPAQSAHLYGAYEGMLPDYHRYTVWMDPTKEGRIFFPHWKIAREFYTSVADYGDLRLRERIYCYQFLFIWCLRYRWYLLRDLVAATRLAFKALRSTRGF